MDVDEALTSLGRWGKWQILFYCVLSIANTFPASWHMLAIVFIGGQPEITCKLPEGVTRNDSIPLDVKGKFSQCLMYKDKSLGNETMECNNGYEYGGERGPTIVTEWELVCDRSFLVETTQTVMVIGVMFGAMFFSAMSDRFGRKPVFLFSEWAMVIVGVATVFVNNYYLFSVLRFLTGALQQGIILTGFVMACELFPADLRTYAGMALENFWAIGMCILAGLAYGIRNWRYLQLCISLPGIVTIALFWFLPESIPWLVVNKRVDQAKEVLSRAARFNGITLPEKFTPKKDLPHAAKDGNRAENADNEQKDRRGLLARLGLGGRQKKAEEEEDAADDGVVRYTLLDVFRNKRLRTYAIIMCCLWFVNSLVYYGLSLSTAALAGDPYMNFFLSGLVEIPAYTSCMFILQKWGRRYPLAGFHIIAGLSLGVTFFIPKELEDGTSLMPLIMTFNMIGKFGITGSFGAVFLYAPEIFPTTLRNQAMGIASVGGRLGNMLAPFSNLVSRVVPWLPGILFGGLSIGVGLLVFLLPETLNRPLPQTIEDIENWSKKPAKDNAPKVEMTEMNNTGSANA